MFLSSSCWEVPLVIRLGRNRPQEPTPSAPPAREALGTGDLGDVHVPSGMVPRYCGMEKTFYPAYPTDTVCHCGHKIGSH
jgi:hypothetical protein